MSSPSTVYTFEMNLAQSGSAITGTSRIESVQSPQYYGIASLTGSTGLDVFDFQENSFTEQNLPPGSEWIPFYASLSVSTNGISMSGGWYDFLPNAPPEVNGENGTDRSDQGGHAQPGTRTSPAPAPSPTPTSSPKPTQASTPTPTTPTPPAPQVTGIVALTQTKKGLTAITMGFDEALNAASVSSAALYSVLGSAKKRGKTLFTKRVPIKQVTYNVAADTVTISLGKPHKGRAQFSFDGVITAANGKSSEGAFSTVVE